MLSAFYLLGESARAPPVQSPAPGSSGPARTRMHWPLELCGSRSANGPVGEGMSTASKVALGISVLLSAGTVAAVHIQQRRVKERLHEGVIRDLERQSRKLENIRLLQEQITLTKQLEAERDKMLMEKGSHQS